MVCNIPMRINENCKLEEMLREMKKKLDKITEIA